MSSSSNFGNVLSMLGASVILPFLPMAPMQILLNNSSPKFVFKHNIVENFHTLIK